MRHSASQSLSRRRALRWLGLIAGKAQPADALKQLQQQVMVEYHQRFPNG